jgi:hypothetical protein
LQRTIRSFLAVVAIASLGWACFFIGSPRPPEEQPTPSQPSEPPKPAPILSPLCGKPLTDPERANLRPIIVKIDNAPAARPQSGLNNACVVWEMIAEGGISRFAAIYHTEEPENIGPIRSSRLIDAELAPIYQGVLAHVSGSEPVQRFLAQHNILDLDQSRYPQVYRRITTRRAPHNVYADVGTLRSLAEELGWKTTDTPLQALTFIKEKAAPTPGAPASVIDIPYSEYTSAYWEWQADIGAYVRSTLGQPHFDEATGERVRAPIVLLLLTEAWPATEIIEDRNVLSLRYRLWDDGDLWAFRDGQAYKGRWVRHKEPHDRLEFLDEQGNPMPLRPGTVWVQVVTPNVAVRWG